MLSLVRLHAAAAVLVLLAACEGSTAAVKPSASFEKIRVVPEPSTGAFVISAIENHFHDIHPVDHVKIAEARPFYVTNYGLFRHNFTVQGTDISKDVLPGQTIYIGFFRPGHYFAYCKYHVSVGMVGQFDIVASSG
jgi:hypothetical protein